MSIDASTASKPRRRPWEPAALPSPTPVPTVIEMQRTRLLSATLRECASKGASDLTVADVVRSAGVSRRTFYELFPDLKLCVLAALEECLMHASSVAREAYEGRVGWRNSVRAGLGALLAHFEHQPDAARALIVQSLSIGPEALLWRRDISMSLAAVLDEGRIAGRSSAAGKASSAPSPLTGEGMVGAVLAVLHHRLAAEQNPNLSELLNPLMCILVAPYLGAAAARRELQQPMSATATRWSQRSAPLAQLPMRLTYRTMRVLLAVGSQPGSSNRQIGIVAGIEDQGQCSKMLVRLRRLGMVENVAPRPTVGGANAWTLTAKGREIEREIATSTQPHGG